MIDKIVLCAIMALVFIWMISFFYFSMGINKFSSKKFKVVWVICAVILGLVTWVLLTKFFYYHIPEQVVNSIDFH